MQTLKFSKVKSYVGKIWQIHKRIKSKHKTSGDKESA